MDTVPNRALQQTGHAKDGSSRHYALTRVSRLLSLVFGLLSPLKEQRTLKTCQPFSETSIRPNCGYLEPEPVGLIRTSSRSRSPSTALRSLECRLCSGRTVSLN
jgi:hypothetical protein